MRQGRVRRLLFHPGLEILLPEYVFEEIREHRYEITRKVPAEALDLLLAKLAHRARIVSVEEVGNEVIEKARRLAKSFDIDDYPFIAVALRYNAIIWTNDKELIRHGLISGEYIAIDTQLIEKLLVGENLLNPVQELRRKYL